jgi:hypothetical protein
MAFSKLFSSMDGCKMKISALIKDSICSNEKFLSALMIAMEQLI